MSKFRHIRTVDRFLYLELGYSGDIGPGGLYDAIVEALEKAGVLEEAGVAYIKARSPELVREAVDVWTPEPVDLSPPTIPLDEPVAEDAPIPNV